MKFVLKAMFQKVLLIGLTLFFTACAHHKDVRPGDGGIHRVTFQTDDKDQGGRSAISQAEHYCESIGKKPVIVEEKNEYTGDMDEKTYKTGKKVSQAAKIVSGTVYTAGGRKESPVGGVVGLGGVVGDTILGDEYKIDMKFKCQ